MLEDRDYMRQTRGKFRWPATAALLVVNVAAYILQVTVLPHVIHESYLQLSLQGLRHGFYWQFLSYQFLHDHTSWIPMHLLLNCLTLYVFGRDVEAALKAPLFLILYFGGGVVGGLFQEFVALVWPFYFGSAVVGASAGIFAVVSAFAILFPERRLTMLLFFVLPVTIGARTLLLIELVITALGISSVQFPALQRVFGGHVAHAAHLGGILTGLAFIRFREEFQRSP